MAETVHPDYPPSRAPAHPVLTWGTVRGRGRALPDVSQLRYALHVTSARVALAHALECLNVAPGESILLPAYHCKAMVGPVVWKSAEPIFYRVNPDTSIDLEDVERRLKPSSRALVAVHYFGFPQDLQALSAFCAKRGLALIEDCAHAFFGETGGHPLGSVGDYAIASSWKFLPVREGGILASSRHPLDCIRGRPAGLAFQARSSLNALEEAGRFKRLRPLTSLCSVPFWIKDRLLDRAKARSSTGDSGTPPMDAKDLGELEDAGFEPEWLGKGMSLFSRFVSRTAGRARIVYRRREFYQRLFDAVEGLAGCRPLFPDLPEGVAPYVFPLLVDEPERVFPILKNRRVPVIRFGEFLWRSIDARAYPVAEDLSRRVFQFPCHQELRASEVDWIARELRPALESRPGSIGRVGFE